MKTRKNKSGFTGRALAALAPLAAAMLAAFTASAGPVTSVGLVHRWSFNGDLNDSVGDATAEPIKSSTSGVIIPSPDPVNYVENGTAVQTGADQFDTYATSLNLGTGLVATNDVTLEIWVTRRSLLTNARLFDWGNGGYNANPSQYVCLPFNDSPVIWTEYKATSSAIASCFGNDTKYHLTFTVTQDGTSSKYHLVRRKASVLSEVPLTLDHTVADWTLSNVVGGRLYLGHSQWNNNERDIDANAIYDEVRIWNGVVPDELLALNAAMGPDALALKYDADGNACFDIPAGEKLPVNANTLGNNYTLAGSVTFGAGAKIEFDTANNPVGMSLTAEGGFNVPSGSILDYVELTDSANFTATLSGNTITVERTAAAPDYFLEWVESKSNLYVDTGVRGRCGTKAEVRFANLGGDDHHAMLAAAKITNGTWANLGFCTMWGRSMRFWYGKTYASDGYGFVPWGGDYLTEVEASTAGALSGKTTKADGTFEVNSVDWSADFGVVDTETSLYLFAEHTIDTSSGEEGVRCYSLARFYHAKIWQIPDGGTDYVLVRDLRPCMKDGVAGVYDAVTDTILYPQGNALKAGPAKYDSSWPAAARVGTIDHPATQYGRIHYAQRDGMGDGTWKYIDLIDYTFMGEGDTSELNGAGGSWQDNNLKFSQLRFDGWFYVDAAKAGTWAINQKFDDYFAFFIDNANVLYNNGNSGEANSTVAVAEGWHRFTIICGDTYGDYGSNKNFGEDIGSVPFVIAVNGTTNAFNTANFPQGSGLNRVTLEADADWSDRGDVILASGAVLDLNGHNLTVKDIVCDDYVGSCITNSASASKKSVLYFAGEPRESKAYIDGLIKEVDVKIILAKNGDQVATWTGAVSGDPANANNWEDLAGEPVVPTAAYTVTIAGNNVNLQAPAGTDIACKSFEIGNCTFTADCDWRGLSVKPTIVGAVNLNGHDIAMPSCGITIAQSGASFSNSAATTNEVRFLANDATVTATEATYIDGIANLVMAANAKIAIVHSSGNSSGTLNVGAVDKHTVFRAESGTISMTANGQVGMTSGGAGYLDIAGGTVDFCTANDRGLQLGGANARSYVTISGGKLRANWIDAGHDGVTECAIVQTGGEVETGINNNGNIWLGRFAQGSATYLLSGGSIILRGGTLEVGTYGTGTFTQDGGSVYVGAGDLIVGAANSATGTYTLNDGSASSKYWFLIGREGTGTFTQNGGTVTLNAGDNDNGNWLVVARNGGVGTYVLNGGLLEAGTGAKGGGICVGFIGRGRFDMNGGMVQTPTIFTKDGWGTVLLNGGTIKATVDGGTQSSRHATDIGIIKNVGNLLIGKGTTIDTDGHNTKIVGCGYEPMPGSALVKSGAGKLSVDVIPPADTLIVSNGTLSVLSDSDNRAPVRLAHRWSFNGNLTDSVGGATATTIGSKADVNYVDDAAVRIGSDQAETYATSLNLGKALAAGESATIEIWAKRSSLTANMRLFDWGLSNEDYICMSWNDNANVWVKTGNRDRFANPAGVVNGCFANNVNCHLGVTFTANTDGTTTVRVLRHNLDDPTAETKTLTTTFPSCDLLSIIAGNLYLGHSQYTSELGNDAVATYDEVRIWKGALDDDALALSAQKGPDATASDIAEIVAATSAASPVMRTLELESGAALEIASGATLTQPILKGKGGAVSGAGTLKISDRIPLNVGDSITASGTIDLTDAKVVLVDPENLTKPFWFIKPAATGTLNIVGKPEAVNLPKGWQISVSANGAKVQKFGFSIYVR